MSWSVYFAVDDTDAALAKVVELGGATVIPAEDTPYGRLAAATDTTGSLFKFVSEHELLTHGGRVSIVETRPAPSPAPQSSGFMNDQSPPSLSRALYSR